MKEDRENAKRGRPPKRDPTFVSRTKMGSDVVTSNKAGRDEVKGRWILRLKKDRSISSDKVKYLGKTFLTEAEALDHVDQFLFAVNGLFFISRFPLTTPEVSHTYLSIGEPAKNSSRRRRYPLAQRSLSKDNEAPSPRNLDELIKDNRKACAAESSARHLRELAPVFSKLSRRNLLQDFAPLIKACTSASSLLPPNTQML